MKNENITENSKNVSFYEDSDLFHLKTSDYFLAISDFNSSNGIDIIKNIVLSKSSEVPTKLDLLDDKNSYILKTMDNTSYVIESTDNLTTISFINTDLNLKRITKSLKVIDGNDYLKNGLKNSKLDLSQIIIINKEVDLKDLLKYYKIAIKTRTEYFKNLNLPKHVENILNKNEFIAVTAIIPKNNVKAENPKAIQIRADTPSNLEFEEELIDSVTKGCENVLDKANISFGILDYVIAEGVTIDALVEAGMALCVGVEDSSEIRDKLKRQILKALEDINVVALLMSAIRCEEDFQLKRLREVDVSDDPAYLYTDEVLGIAIANQIAGTKATFNFKRYDEEKPGIIAKLGPMVDDIFAGLVAGCMSKIFEDD